MAGAALCTVPPSVDVYNIKEATDHVETIHDTVRRTDVEVEQE